VSVSSFKPNASSHKQIALKRRSRVILQLCRICRRRPCSKAPGLALAAPVGQCSGSGVRTGHKSM
jgi:hypothetical protein